MTSSAAPKTVRSLAALAALFVVTTVAHAQFYTAISIGAAFGANTSSGASGVNFSGQVVGSEAYGTTAYLYSGGSLTNLGPGYATAINNSGTIVVGGSTYSGGNFTSLGDLGFGYGAYGAAINNSGQVTGYSQNTNGDYHAFLYSNGTMTDLGTLLGNTPGTFSSSGAAINSGGQVVGSSNYSINSGQAHAFLYSGGSMSDLGTLGGSYSAATGINDFGQIVGYSATTNNGSVNAFLYSNGTMTDLGEGYANGINNLGQVVGQSNGAFIYSSGSITNLNSITDLSGTNFVSLIGAVAISDSGYIVGQGLTSGGSYQAFLLSPTNVAPGGGGGGGLSPVPEPSTYAAIFAAGLLGLAGLRWRQRLTAAPVSPAS